MVRAVCQRILAVLVGCAFVSAPAGRSWHIGIVSLIGLEASRSAATVLLPVVRMPLLQSV